MSKNNNKTEMTLDNSILLTDLSTAQVEFIQDNEKAILALVQDLIIKESCIITLKCARKEIVEYQITELKQF